MKTTEDMDFNWYDSLPRADDVDRFTAAVEKVITAENYGKRWCVSQFADRDIIPVHALSTAENIITGYDPVDRRENADRAISRDITVKLQVLTRQACTFDRDGKEIGEVSMDEKPQEGDRVVLCVGKRRGPGGKALTANDYARLRAQGLTASITKEHVVKNGCIEVPFYLGFGLLQDYGFRNTKPQFYTVEPSKKDISLAIAHGTKPRSRQIANWLYREVFDDGQETAPADDAGKYRRK